MRQLLHGQLRVCKHPSQTRVVNRRVSECCHTILKVANGRWYAIASHLQSCTSRSIKHHNLDRTPVNVLASDVAVRCILCWPAKQSLIGRVQAMRRICFPLFRIALLHLVFAAISTQETGSTESWSFQSLHRDAIMPKMHQLELSSATRLLATIRTRQHVEVDADEEMTPSANFARILSTSGAWSTWKHITTSNQKLQGAKVSLADTTPLLRRPTLPMFYTGHQKGAAQMLPKHVFRCMRIFRRCMEQREREVDLSSMTERPYKVPLSQLTSTPATLLCSNHNVRVQPGYFEFVAQAPSYL